MKWIYIAAAVIACSAVAWQMIKNEKGGRSMALSSLAGIASLFAVNTAGLITGITLSVNWYTLALSAVMGLPGVIALLAANIILK